MLLTAEWIQDIYKAAIAVHADRETLLGGMPPAFVAELDTKRNRTNQLYSDLEYMNQVGSLGDGIVPLRIWLRAAVVLFEIRAQVRVFEEALRRLDDVEPPPLPPRSWMDALRYPFHDARAARLRSLLVAAYGERHSARMLAERVPIELERWIRDRGIGPAWDSLLELSAAQGKLRALAAAVLTDGSVSGYHEEIRSLVEAAERTEQA